MSVYKRFLPDQKFSIGDIAADGRTLLVEMGLDYSAAALETDLIIRKVTGFDRIHILINPEQEIDQNTYDEIMRLLNLRKSGMPMAYVLGQRDFMGLDFYCQQGVLIPRSDTEVLVETVIEKLEESGVSKNMYGIEIGAGTGIISISLLSHFSQLSMVAGDINEKAIELTRKNAIYADEQLRDIHGEHITSVSKRLSVIYSNLFDNIESLKLYDSENHADLYDFIVSNPPYIKTEVIETLMSDVKDFEPHNALDGTHDGLYFYRQIIDKGYPMIRPGGLVAFEIGFDQGEEVSELMKNRGYRDVEVRKDLAGLDRVVTGFR